ncbi:tetratricopeptide repeat protein [Sphingomonas sp.]|uniref:tetratricopeptide repeat protein n=1 Tax=Sphingomonas sp. TaxID=28214 RepID=UPI00286B5016|nr:tetratricopeptide repeat protein [Sphingomonas sp.]
MPLLLLAAAVVAVISPPPAVPLNEAAHAIEAGRLDQARIMIGDAVKAGATGDAIDRLLADLDFESGDFQSALVRYGLLLGKHSGDLGLAEHAGIAAVHTGDIARAAILLERATTSPTASWRAWNARGVAADFRSDWTVADLSYSKALALNPGRAETVNNLGWSLLLRGRWAEAAEQLEKAATLDPKNARIANNLDLAQAAATQDLPQRRTAENDSDWSARLNDAGVMARFRGDQKRAIAAFAQAIEARSQWYERAANNLALSQAGSAPTAQ